MNKLIPFAALAVLAHRAPAQVTETPRASVSYLGPGLARVSGFYSGSSKGESGITFAPAVLGCGAMTPSVAFRWGVAYGRNLVHWDYPSNNNTQRTVGQTTTGNVVVPVLLQLTLNPAAPRFHTALLGGLTFWYINQRGQQTDYYHAPSGSATAVRRKLDREHLYTFLTGGVNASYQLTPRWVALADLTLNFRLGEKTQYYEAVPSGGMQLGAGYCWGTVR